MSTQTNAEQDQIRLRIAKFVHGIANSPAETETARTAAREIFKQQPVWAQEQAVKS